MNITERQASSADFNNWIVSISFATPDGGNQGSDTSNPLNDPIEIDFSWQGRSKRTWTDGNGSPVANTAGELYTEGLEVEDSLPTIVYSLNQAAFSETLAMSVRNGINKNAWKIFAPFSIRVASIRARTKYHRQSGDSTNAHTSSHTAMI